MEQDIKPLENTIRYTGFSQLLVPAIMEEAGRGNKEFTAYDRRTFKGQTVDYELRLRMPEHAENGVPYLRGFQATFADDPSKTQYIDCFQDTRFTAMDAYELLAGKTVTKSFSIDFAHRDKNNNHYINRKRVTVPEEDLTQRLPRTQAEPLPETGKNMGRGI